MIVAPTPSPHRSAPDRLAELAGAIERDPAHVAREARALADEARADQQWTIVSRAQAVLGRAWRMLGEVDAAARALTDAIEAARMSGDPYLEADAHIALAGVLSMGGRWADGLGHLDEAERIGSDELRLSAKLQRAVVVSNLGRLDEALEIFGRVIPELRRSSRPLDLARGVANRATIHLARGDVADAVRGYEEAESLFDATGQAFAAALAHENLGCAVAHLGDLPRALALFDDAARRLAALGHDASAPLLARAEALLLAGLSADAATFSNEAARRLEAAGSRAAAERARLIAAEASRVEGDLHAALELARNAREWFAGEGSEYWERAARLEEIRCRYDLGELDVEEIGALCRLADTLAAAGYVRGEVPARCLATLAACACGHLDIAERQATLAARAARRSSLLSLRLAAHHAVAAYRLTTGDRTPAKRELRLALEELTMASRLGGAGDADAGLATHAREIERLLVQVAATERQPMRALTWMERAIDAVLPPRPALPPADERVAAEFAELRAVAAELRHAEQADEPSDELRHRHAQLERTMRVRWLTMPGQGASSRFELPPQTDFKRRIGAMRANQVVSLAFDRDSVLAVVADGGRLRRIVLPIRDDLLVAIHRAGNAMRGLASSRGVPALTGSRRQALDAAVDTIEALLLERLELDGDHVVIVAPSELHVLPWAAMPSLSGRSFALAPSVSWWLAASEARPAAPRSALVVAGPRLEHAVEEACGVGESYHSADVLVGADASIANVTAAMARHDVLHVVAHGRFRHDNPLWSTIELADGELTAYELERWSNARGTVPPTVVLATCESGVGGARGGRQLRGLTTTLLGMGVSTVVAAIGALPDDAETRRTMVELHRDLARGIGASASLLRQRQERPSVTAAGLVTHGVG